MKRTNKRHFILCVLFVMVMLLCRPITTQAAGKAELSASSKTLDVGKSYTLVLKNAKLKTAYYYPSKTSIKMLGNGKVQVTAKEAGTTKVTIETKTGERLVCKFIIRGMSKPIMTMYVGQKETLNVNDSRATWTSNNKAVATVNKKGKVTAKKVGTAVITAKVGTSKFTSRITVQANPSKPVKMNKTKLTLQLGRMESVTVQNAGNSPKLSVGKGLSVSKGTNSYYVKAMEPGTWKWSVTVGSKTATCTVTVPKPETNVDKLMPKAPAKIRQAFKSLGGKITYHADKSYAGCFEAKTMTIDLSREDDVVPYHELGHFVTWMGSNKEVKIELEKAYLQEKSLYQKYNKAYVCSSKDEYAAESFKDYCLYPYTLKKERPKTYAVIEKCVKNTPDNAAKWKNIFFPHS